jgi:hypothetical protein
MGHKISDVCKKKRVKQITKIKKEIIKYTIIAAAAAAFISFLFYGLNIMFPYGLAIGVCASVINLGVISASIKRAVERGRKEPVTAGFIVRTLIYAGALVLAARTGALAFYGAALGVLVPHIVIFVKYAIIPAFRRKLGREPMPVYVTDTSSKLFIKDPWLVSYKRGRTYLTYKHFRKVNINKAFAVEDRNLALEEKEKAKRWIWK